MGDARIETIGQAVRGVFRDPKWLRKCALGAVIAMVPYVGGVWLMGWGLHYQRAVIYGDGDRLPEWNNAQPQIRTGFFAMVVGLVFTLPLSVIFGVVLTAVVFASAFTVQGLQDIARILVPITLVALVFFGVSLLLGVVLWPVYLHVQLYDTIGAGFELRRIFGLAKQHSALFWITARRSLLLALLSMVLPVLSMLLTLGAMAALFTYASVEVASLGMMLVYPVQLVLTIASGIVVLPITLATYRLWGGYAVEAYDLSGLAEQRGMLSEPALAPA